MEKKKMGSGGFDRSGGDDQQLFFMGPYYEMFIIFTLQLQIWDTAGQERFRSITQSYYHSADALVLVFDVTSTESFNALPSWLKEVEQYASPKVISVLVGK